MGIFNDTAPIVEDDIEGILNFIDYAFPYTSFTAEKIKEKVHSKNFYLVKHLQGNIITGFIELEFFSEKNEARLNAVFVEETWRGQHIATKLIKQVIHECKRRRVHRLFLLVSESNDGAKELYKKTGFAFEGMHDKIIEAEKVEVWSMKIS